MTGRVSPKPPSSDLGVTLSPPSPDVGVNVDTTQSRAKPTTLEQLTIRRVIVRLVPFMALMFFINFLDRTAIGFAAPNGMNKDLGLSAAQFGFASGVFFIGLHPAGGSQQHRAPQVRG